MSQGCHPDCYYYTDSCFRKDCTKGNNAVKAPVPTSPDLKEEELWGADPNCQHDIQPAPGGGVKCSKCRGWFCY